ncbi:cation transporting ATPase C-terminal domain-containing protein [Streptomyces sp. ISID311]|uniref:cation transporting ATPase C-terminal domain-containing protein n=1 Tax=Streptomyces sp. ISID311 TaxID=2601673 RepID=UPI0021C2FBA2|nr:cation transporting ATPase C-terminal domain-containing protein [Streptomyces sp. ISID311]
MGFGGADDGRAGHGHERAAHHPTAAARQALFQSGWFIEGLLSQTLIVHMIRTRKIPFLQSRASWPVMVMTALAMATGLFLPFSPLAAGLGMVALPMSYFPWLIAVLLSYCALTQGVKTWYVRRFGSWL